MEKYHFTKDQVSYYVHNYYIDNHKQGRFTVINRKEFDRIIKERMETNSLAQEIERRKKQPKVTTIPDGYVTTAQIAEKYSVTVQIMLCRSFADDVLQLFSSDGCQQEVIALKLLFQMEVGNDIAIDLQV